MTPTTTTDGTLESVRRHLQQQAREAGYLDLLMSLWAWTATEIARTRAMAIEERGEGRDGIVRAQEREEAYCDDGEKQLPRLP